jgi:2,3-dihydroxybenzoate-AMP ligase
MDSAFTYSDVADIVRDNAALDTELAALADAITPDLLHASQGSVRWTLAEQLGHIGEFPRFLAADLAAWLARGGQVGRTHDESARMTAIAAAPSKALGELKGALTPAFAALSAVLEQVTPDHLAAQVDHRMCGSEPLANYVSRDIIGHKRQHIAQLRASFDYLGGGRIRLDGFVPVPQNFAERYRRDGLWQGRTLGELFDQWAARSCDRAALSGIDVDGVAQHLSYAVLHERVNNLAAHLHRRGIALGSRVVVQLPNVPGFVTLLLALFKIGAVPVLALPQHGEHEIGYLLDHSGATAYAVARMFRGDDCLARARRLSVSRPSLQHLLVSGEPGANDVIALDRLETTPPPSGVIPGPVACDVAMFLLSGGTTGAPKLIPRTHDDYALNLRESARVCGFDQSTVYLAALPAAHNFPLGCPGILGTLSAGGRVVLAPSPDAETALLLVERERVTATALVPALAIRWMESARLAERDLSSLTLLQVGGQRFQAEHARLVRPTLGSTLQQVFGMAEGLLNYTRPDDPQDVILETQGRPLLPQDEVRLVDENDLDVSEGMRGELLARGPYTLRGYFRTPEHNARSFTPDGFYRSGDIVRWSRGNLVVEGRIKDLINRGGEKISAEEVENLILAHPGVMQAAVVAMKDRVLGERVCAFLVTRGGASVVHKELNQFLLRRGLAKFKLPERIETLEELPLTNVGKVDKKALRDRLA